MTACYEYGSAASLSNIGHAAKSKTASVTWVEAETSRVTCKGRAQGHCVSMCVHVTNDRIWRWPRNVLTSGIGLGTSGVNQ